MKKELKAKIINLIENKEYFDASAGGSLSGISVKFALEEIFGFYMKHKIVGYNFVGNLNVSSVDDGETNVTKDANYYFNVKTDKLTTKNALDKISEWVDLED